MSFELEVRTPKHVYGWRRPLPGQEAKDLLPPADPSGLTILNEVDPRPLMPPLQNQLRLGACTAHADEGAFWYDAILDGADCGPLSRLFIYYGERKIEHTLGQGDVGAMGHDGFTVAKHGIPGESQWPYDIEKFQDKPPTGLPVAYYLRKQVHSPAQNQSTFAAVLSNKQTISFGFTVYDSFEEEWATPGVMPVPDPEKEGVLGGHQNLVIGFLAAHKGYWLIRNSWIEGDVLGLGVDGYYLMPSEVLLNPQMASDFRTIVRPV